MEENVWYLPLTGDADAAEELRRVFAGSEVEIVADGNRSYLTSPAIKHASSSEEALRLGRDVMELVIRAFVVKRGRVPDSVLQNTTFRIGSARVLTYGLTEGITVQGRLISGSLEEIDADGNPVAGPTPLAPAGDSLHDVRELLRKAEAHPEVNRALGYLHSGDYAALYKLYEVIQHDCGGSDRTLTDPPRAYISAAMLNRVKANLNNPRISGEYARHAVMPGAPPAALRMSSQEIHSVLKMLFDSWVADKQ